MRKTCSSSKTPLMARSRLRLLSRSSPNGFSATSRVRSARPSRSSIAIMSSTAVGGTER